MRNRNEIKQLRKDLYELRGDFCELSHKVNNPAKFKKGDKVEWLRYGESIGRGIVNSCKMETSSCHAGWRSYHWLYVIIDGAEIRNIYEEFLSYDTPSK